MDARAADRRFTNRCACGWMIEGELDEVVEATIDHGKRIHNMEATREQVVAALAAVQAARPPEATGE